MLFAYKIEIYYAAVVPPLVTALDADVVVGDGVKVGGSVVALRYHNFSGPGMSRDTLYSGVMTIFRSVFEKSYTLKIFNDSG
nr:hypothetical protein [Mycobacterium lepromatosis]